MKSLRSARRSPLSTPAIHPPRYAFIVDVQKSGYPDLIKGKGDRSTA
ncbi:hypothetical protein [Scytonema sp. HK-05]|nr:hypothetical protein [Scytonema sp. HK-05]